MYLPRPVIYLRSNSATRESHGSPSPMQAAVIQTSIVKVEIYRRPAHSNTPLETLRLALAAPLFC